MEKAETESSWPQQVQLHVQLQATPSECYSKVRYLSKQIHRDCKQLAQPKVTTLGK